MTDPRPHTEAAFEELIATHLVTQGGYQWGDNARWSRELALDRATLFAFVQESQPAEWKRLTDIHGPDVEIRFLQRLVKELDNRGTLDVLRHGIIDYGVRFRLAYFNPVSGLNPELQRLFRAQQAHHHSSTAL